METYTAPPEFTASEITIELHQNSQEYCMLHEYYMEMCCKYFKP